jgi:DNA polymerase-3 subunit alpha
MKLKSKKILQYKGEVVDLNVSNSHTYNVEGKAVHNSGGGSLVAYVLYITDLDPLFWDLPFARFLSVYRKGAPDIDTDLADRDKVLEQLRQFFGFENVVPISNYNTFKLKTLVKDIGKFYGVPFEETNAATRTVEDDVRKATTKHGDDKNLFVLKYEDAIVHSPSFKAFIDKYPQIAESIQILFKQNRSLGRHAGGVLIADDLPNKMPLITSGGEPQSPWVEGVNFKHLEYIGNFIKYDLLGLETMRLIERTIELILIKEGNPSPVFDQVKAWYDKYLAPAVIDFDDPKPFEVYEKARWAGIFQLTSQGAQRLFVKAKPKSIVDIATLTSIYRPGPLAANVDKLYLEAREGNEFDWGDRRINAILEKTKGLIIFQEQVMELAEKCAGFPKAQCDEVRRAIMKRSISGGEAAKKAAQETRDGFVKGCVNNGYTEAVANNLYDKILYFAGYGFNKSLYFSQELCIYNSDGSFRENKKIEDVVAGDYVMSRDESTKEDIFVRVVDRHDHGVLPLVEVELTTGEKIRCTMDHKFRTQETGEMMPLWMIQKLGLSIVVSDVTKKLNTRHLMRSMCLLVT